MTAREVAADLNVGEKTVYRPAQLAEPPGFKVAETWCFKKDDIDRLLEQRKTQAALEERSERRDLTFVAPGDARNPRGNRR